MDIIKIEKGILKLNSGIAEENYGKMSYSQIIKEEGLLIHAVKSENGYEFNSESWTFDDVQSDGNVFYCGKVPFFSKKAASLLELLESENAFEAGNVIIHFLTENAKERRDINLIGAGGIYIEFDKKGNAEILMLPHDLFNYSMSGLSEKDKAELNNWLINPTLKNVQAYRFMRSVIAYKIITGNIPYPATDIIERNSDILDEKFLPLEY